MNIKALKATLLRHFTWPGKEIFYVFLGTIISFVLIFYISNYFYFLAIPLLLYMFLFLMTEIKDAYHYYLGYCRNERYMSNGSHTIKEENGKYIVNLLNGKRHGTFIEYFINGQIELECNYINGELDGIYKSYFINGQIETDCNYINGKLHGENKEYYVNGALKLQTQYKEGIQYGETKSFYNNGNIYREVNFVNGKYEGEIKEYFKNGNLKFIKNEAKYTFFDEVQKHILFDGNLSLVDGVWNSYRNDGTIEYQLSFEDKKGKSLKIIFTKSGEFYSKKYYDYKFFKGIHVNYSNEFSGQRLDSKIITKPTTVKGPPGLSNGFTVNVSQIKSIEDIIELTPIKDFENE